MPPQTRGQATPPTPSHALSRPLTPSYTLLHPLTPPYYRLPEFKFWYSLTKAFVVAFTLTFFAVFNIPVAIVTYLSPPLVLTFFAVFNIPVRP